VTQYRGLAADSRDVRPGFLFAALPGTKVDGANFMSEAVKRGAVAVLGVPEAASQASALGVEFLPAANPRLALSRLAAEFYGAQPKTVAAVTGTNGKTSVASFLRQIWTDEGRHAASLGTLGIVSPSGTVALSHTTPDPVRIHAELARLETEGVEWLALEASSHGLDQFRLDGVKIAAAGFTNITRDHLDYHATFENYVAAKTRLFEELVTEGGPAIINSDAEHWEVFAIAAKRAALKVLTVGENGEFLRLTGRAPRNDGQDIYLHHAGRDWTVRLKLAGLFQASNVMVAAGLAIGLGDNAEKVFAALERLRGAPGRLELMARSKTGAAIYVDYAHTPDALETILRALRPHTKGKLHVVFGCGGNRDKGKRPMMGKIACELADDVIVTDDNPRDEDALIIRQEVLAGCSRAREIGERGVAIRAAVENLSEGDVLVLAGKGHEETQIVKGISHPFSDRTEAVRIARELGGEAA
jgi:UDP-N-acetylmuramoyl-L-alanyl-D-glutamate--2,6-diaminopimelate ligase